LKAIGTGDARACIFYATDDAATFSRAILDLAACPDCRGALAAAAKAHSASALSAEQQVAAISELVGVLDALDSKRAPRRRLCKVTCAPPPNTLWLEATYHKTGTVMNQGVGKAIAAASGGHLAYLNKDGEITTGYERGPRREITTGKLVREADEETRRKISLVELFCMMMAWERR